LLIAGSETAANHRPKQDIHTPARIAWAPKLGKVFANCPPFHAWHALPVAVEPSNENANFRIMSLTDPIILKIVR
jgi:hypothetical protein